jgi:hypothetical protein
VKGRSTIASMVWSGLQSSKTVANQPFPNDSHNGRPSRETAQPNLCKSASPLHDARLREESHVPNIVFRDDDKVRKGRTRVPLEPGAGLERKKTHLKESRRLSDVRHPFYRPWLAWYPNETGSGSVRRTRQCHAGAHSQPSGGGLDVRSRLCRFM